MLTTKLLEDTMPNFNSFTYDKDASTSPTQKVTAGLQKVNQDIQKNIGNFRNKSFSGSALARGF